MHDQVLRDTMPEPRKSLADLGLDRVSLSYVEDGSLKSAVFLVTHTTLQKVLDTLETGEIS